jgi:hypothetical protein
MRGTVISALVDDVVLEHEQQIVEIVEEKAFLVVVVDHWTLELPLADNAFLRGNRAS